MKIILNEMKKIFSFKMTCLLILVSILIYNMFMSFDFTYFPNGRPQTDEYRILTKFIKENGNTMGPEQLKRFEKLYNDKLKEADEFIKNNDEFKKVGVHSYEEIQKAMESGDTKVSEVFNKYMFNSNQGTIFWELEALESDLGLYKAKEEDSRADKSLALRINEILKNKEDESILPTMVYDNYNRVITYLGFCVVISTALKLVPIFIRDKKDRLDHIQYSSKYGRKIFKSKIAAGILASLLITTIQTILDFMMYKKNNVSMFFNSNINSALNHKFWFSMTFIQYIIVTVILLYILSLVTAIITMFISSKVSTYVAGVGITVLMLFVLTKLIEIMLLNDVFIVGKPKYLVFIIYPALVACSIIMIYKSYKKIKVKDILE